MVGLRTEEPSLPSVTAAHLELRTGTSLSAPQRDRPGWGVAAPALTEGHSRPQPSLRGSRPPSPVGLLGPREWAQDDAGPEPVPAALATGLS